ncbi:MAG: 4Fe-4S binding protein [Candidatus Hodarchaeales archaeon]
MILVINISINLCIGCAYCAMVCPVGSFEVEGVSKFLQECTKCGKCVRYCPVSAITSQWEK